jgi:hypothetical protein
MEEVGRSGCYILAVSYDGAVCGHQFIHLPVGGGAIEHAASFAEVTTFLSHLHPFAVLIPENRAEFSTLAAM